MIDKTKSKLGKARPWMLYAQIGVSLCLLLLFSVPDIGETAQYAYFFVFYTSLNAIFYTANGIAYSTLSALITKNSTERVQLGSIRFMFAVVTNIVMGVCGNRCSCTFWWRSKRMESGCFYLCSDWSGFVNTISCLAVKEVPDEENTEIQEEAGQKDDKLSFVDTIKIYLQISIIL